MSSSFTAFTLIMHYFDNIYNCFSERGTRRKLPNVPNSQSHNSLNTQSLPRPPKGDTVRREQSESRSRDR